MEIGSHQHAPSSYSNEDLISLPIFNEGLEASKSGSSFNDQSGRMLGVSRLAEVVALSSNKFRLSRFVLVIFRFFHVTSNHLPSKSLETFASAQCGVHTKR